MKRTMLGRVCSNVGLALALVGAAASTAWAQNAVLRGTVRSDGGDAIVGANVYFTELNLQAATSDAGRFTLTVPGDRIRGQTVQLRVRAIGYRPSSRAVTLVAGEQTVDFQLVQDINRLEEIIVTGVIEGTEQARVPFSVARVDMADVPVPAGDPVRLLAGRVPGATIISASGRPGGSASIILRGPTSIDASGRGQGPLFILDGVILNGGLPDINPGDIENIEVVRGAAASSLYGARAGNGVIQITTRTGRRAAEGMTFNVRGEYGRSDIEGEFLLARQTAMIMDSRNQRLCVVTVAGAPHCAETIDWATEAARINNLAGDGAAAPRVFPLDPQSTTFGPPLRNAYQANTWPGMTYNAIDQVVHPSEVGQLTVDATGRLGSTQFFSSFSFNDNGGAIRFLNGYERYSGRVNVDQRIAEDWTIQLRSYFAHSTEDGLDSDGGIQNGAGNQFFQLTRVPAPANLLGRDTLGRLYIRPNVMNGGSQNVSPTYRWDNQSDIGETDRFIGGLTVRFAPASWVDFEGNTSYDLANFNEQFFRDKGFRAVSAGAAVSAGSIFQQHVRDQSFNTSLNMTIRRRLTRGIDSRWSFRTLYERQDSENRNASGNTLGSIGVPDLNNATAGFSVGSGTSSVRQVGLFAGVNLDFLDGRYVVDGLIRRDGTSLFGADNRWATFGRVSLLWRPSLESWWFGGRTVNDLKLRFSRGSAGGRPSFLAQYETFGTGAVGPTLGLSGSRVLRPEITVDNEFGADLELFRRIGVQLTRAVSETRDQILRVPLSADKGFGELWGNAGTLQNKTWELSVNVPVVARRNVNWSWRFTYDRTRTVITQLNVPPFTHGAQGQGTGSLFFAREGERYGTFYGREFARSCGDLPSAFQSDCGTEGVSSYQFNDEGYLVWVGQGNSWRDGISRNLWQTRLSPGATTPWGIAFNWGIPIIIRDTSCVTTPSEFCPAAQRPLGNALPDYQFAVSSNLQFRRFTVFGLLQGVMGRDVWNEGRHWSHLDFITRAVDQRNKGTDVAKPIGYYWRTSPTDGFTGLGGFYDILAQNSHFTEDASYMKLRELMVSYNVGPVGGVGNWTFSVVGRNLFTITDYLGFDPEVGQSGGTASAAAVNAVDGFSFPNPRSLTFTLSTSF